MIILKVLLNLLRTVAAIFDILCTPVRFAVMFMSVCCGALVYKNISMITAFLQQVNYGAPESLKYMPEIIKGIWTDKF